MPMNNPVLVASFADEVSSLDSHVRNSGAHNRQTVVAIGLDYYAQHAFRALGYNCKSTEPFLDNSAHESVSLHASRFARNWHQSLPRETLRQLSHDGLSFPETLAYDIAQLFTEVLLHIEILRAIIRRERPDPLILVDHSLEPVETFTITPKERFLSTLAQQVCAAAEVDVRFVPPVAAVRRVTRRRTEIAAWLRKALDIYQAIRLDANPFSAFLSYALPVVLSGSAFGSAIYNRRLRQYRGAPRKLLFWGGSRAKHFLLERLYHDPDTAMVCLSEDRRWRFQRFLVPRVDPRTFYEHSSSRALDEGRVRARLAWNGIAHDEEFQDSLQYCDVKLWPVLQHRLDYYINVRFPACVEFYEATLAFLEQQGGDVLVSSVDVGGFTSWVYQAVSRLRKESIYLWHGLLIPHPGIEEGLLPALLPLGARHVGVPGTATAEWYAQNGIAGERIHAIGFPDLRSDYCPLPAAQRRAGCRILGLDWRRPIVVYATSVTLYGGRRAYSEETGDEILRATGEILEELASDSEIQVILKLHPGLSRRELLLFDEMAGPFPNAVVCQMPTLGQLIRLSDILITYQSSAGVEALAHGKDVIVYNTTSRCNQYSPSCMKVDDLEANFYVLVDRRSDLRLCVKKLLYDEAFRSKLRKHRKGFDPLILHNWDGQAADRAMLLLQEAFARVNESPGSDACLKTVSLPH